MALSRRAAAVLACTSLFVASACTESVTLMDAGPAADAAIDAGATETDGGAADAGAADAGTAEADAGAAECGPDERTTRLVYYGTAAPTHLPLTPGQVLAVVDFGATALRACGMGRSSRTTR